VGAELMCLGNDLTLIGGAALALKVVVLDCLGPRETPLDGEAQKAHKAATQSALDSMEKCLKYQHKATWKYVVHVLQAVYQVCVPFHFRNQGFMCFRHLKVISVENESMLNRTMNLLAGIRQGDDQFDLAAEIDKAFVALVKNLGPEQLLMKVPLQVG
jgi:NUC173 domain